METYHRNDLIGWSSSKIEFKDQVGALVSQILRQVGESFITRNQSSSQLQKGANQNRGPPTLSRDEDPYWVWEDPPQLVQELPPTWAMVFMIKIIIFVMI